MPSLTSALPCIGKREVAATRTAFFIVGFTVGSWAPMIPLAKTRLALDDAQLGLILLSMGMGSIIAMPFCGGLAGKFGCRRVLLSAGSGSLIALLCMSSANNSIFLAFALSIFGASIGTMDVTMNIQAVAVEKSMEKSMMSGFHGLYSVGGIAGAGAVAGLALLNVTVNVAAMMIVGVCAMLLAAYWRGFLPLIDGKSYAPIAIPRGRIVLIGVLCFIVFLAEGSVLDWGGVFLAEYLKVAPSLTGFGYIAFATTMTLGRLCGDHIVKLVGRRRMLTIGGALTALGFVVAVLIPSFWTSILGFGLVGAGAANVVPILFTAAGNQIEMPANLAISAVTTMGYAGILVGPAMIGFVAKASTLSIALLVVAAMLILVPLSTPRVLPNHSSKHC